MPADPTTGAQRLYVFLHDLPRDTNGVVSRIPTEAECLGLGLDAGGFAAARDQLVEDGKLTISRSPKPTPLPTPRREQSVVAEAAERDAKGGEAEPEYDETWTLTRPYENPDRGVDSGNPFPTTHGRALNDEPLPVVDGNAPPKVAEAAGATVVGGEPAVPGFPADPVPTPIEGVHQAEGPKKRKHHGEG